MREENAAQRKRLACKRSGMGASARLLALWALGKRQLRLAGIRARTGGVKRGAQEMHHSLQMEWTPVFEKGHKVLAEAKASLAGRRWPRLECALPSGEDLLRCAKVARSSAPGPDGRRYAAWHGARRTGGGTLALLLQHGCDTGCVLEGLCAASLAFLPKGPEDDDELGAVRGSAKVRPLGMMNTDLAIMCSGPGVNRSLRESIGQHARSAQRGFMRGRSLAMNILDLDTSARVTAIRTPGGRFPVMIFWDFAAAFPSVSQQWLLENLLACGLPGGMRAFIKAMHERAMVYTRLGGELGNFASVRAGVLQGSQLSGSFFALALGFLLGDMSLRCCWGSAAKQRRMILQEPLCPSTRWLASRRRARNASCGQAFSSGRTSALSCPHRQGRTCMARLSCGLLGGLPRNRVGAARRREGVESSSVQVD